MSDSTYVDENGHPFVVGGDVYVAGDDKWTGSTFLWFSGPLVEFWDPGLGGEPSAWVELDPPPPNWPERRMAFRLSTLRSMFVPPE